jgi:sec-independent protein translocase protein TatC
MATESDTRQVMGEQPPEAEMPEDRTQSMSFLDHLEELRWSLIKGLIGIGLGILIAAVYSDFLVNRVLLGPTRASFFLYDWLGIDAVDLTLQSRKLPGQFFTYWGTILVLGFVIGAPILFYHLWKFLEPAMMSKEKKKTFLTTLFITFFFILGLSFGYFILTPFALQFFTQFQIADVVRNDFDINQYFTTMTMWVLSCGVIFQMPVVSYFLSKFGLLTPDFLRQYRRQAIVICFVLAAFLTPPDPVSQVIIAVPLLFLYQLAIIISKYAMKKRQEELEEAFGG